MEWASIFAPQTPTEEELKTALASGDVFAEESVAEIFRLLGLGDIARLVFAPPVDSEPDDVEIVRLDTGTHEHWGIHCNLALEPRRGSRPLAIIYWMPLDDDARREVIHRASEEFRRRGIRGERSTFGALDEATLFQRMDAIRAKFAERHRR